MTDTKPPLKIVTGKQPKALSRVGDALDRLEKAVNRIVGIREDAGYDDKVFLQSEAELLRRENAKLAERLAQAEKRLEGAGNGKRQTRILKADNITTALDLFEEVLVKELVVENEGGDNGDSGNSG